MSVGNCNLALSDYNDPMTEQYIVKTPGTCGGKPRLAGHRIRVQDIVYYSEWCGWSPDRIATNFDLSLAQVHAALLYYFENMEEIRQHFREAEVLYEEMKKNYPSRLAEKISALESSSETKSA